MQCDFVLVTQIQQFLVDAGVVVIANPLLAKLRTLPIVSHESHSQITIKPVSTAARFNGRKNSAVDFH
ncbi:MAG: hypothetical protein ACK4RS_04270, partial [Thiothrix sp.]